MDEFGKTAKPDVTAKAGMLCLPAKKVTKKSEFPILHPNALLVCFQVGPKPKVPTKTPVYAQNQFGTAKVTIISAQWLCLPSKKASAMG
jgi:hypothetical protein